jgi:hypothetical protein
MLRRPAAVAAAAAAAAAAPRCCCCPPLLLLPPHCCNAAASTAAAVPPAVMLPPLVAAAAAPPCPPNHHAFPWFRNLAEIIWKETILTRFASIFSSRLCSERNHLDHIYKPWYGFQTRCLWFLSKEIVNQILKVSPVQY